MGVTPQCEFAACEAQKQAFGIGEQVVKDQAPWLTGTSSRLIWTEQFQWAILPTFTIKVDGPSNKQCSKSGMMIINSVDSLHPGKHWL